MTLAAAWRMDAAWQRETRVTCREAVAGTTVAPKGVRVLILGTCECVNYLAKKELRLPMGLRLLTTDLQIGRLSWITQCPGSPGSAGWPARGGRRGATAAALHLALLASRWRRFEELHFVVEERNF